MNTAQIEGNVKALLEQLISNKITYDDFIYDLLLAYGKRKSTITRLRGGDKNLALKNKALRNDTVILKRHLYFQVAEGNTLTETIERIQKEKLVTTHKIRFILVTNFDQLQAIDTKTHERINISLDELPKHFDFFLPWAGIEKATYKGENPADVKAAEKMAKLFDEIKQDNFNETNQDDTEALHGLNVFLTRLLFCLFAEDTNIFSRGQFSLAIESHTQKDGSDLANYLNRLFDVLNTPDTDRKQLPEYLNNFPYVNGGLFSANIPSPTFNTKSRRALIECGNDLDWSDINPDIFGSMIQAVVHPSQRSNMGMHYTSITNIMKVIEPLFLNDLYDALDKAQNSPKNLLKLQERIGKIKIFDPACGSGNFLIIAYKELRKLEMEVLRAFQDLETKKTGGQITKPFSVIKLTQFYGIELDHFAHEVAILSLWLTEHQMNVEFKAEFGEALPSLPLKSGGNIVCGNAARIHWPNVCPRDGETYILGNPPYLGTRNQNNDHKKDIDYVFGSFNKRRKLDYISIWFYLAGTYISSIDCKFSFVTTNSISQGEQIPLLWPLVLKNTNEISFIHEEFNWSNNAKNKAGVTVVIIGVNNKTKLKKKIYTQDTITSVDQINPHLKSGPTVYVEALPKAISDLPKMVRGNYTGCCQSLILTQNEYNDLLNKHPKASKYIRKYLGSSELIKKESRFCLWISDEELENAKKFEFIKKRINLVEVERFQSSDKGQNRIASRSHQFREFNETKDISVVIPVVSSFRRTYIPCDIVQKGTIVPNSAQIVYDCDLHIFSILMSRMHMLWLRLMAGKLRSDIRYSSSLCWNTFPFPKISSEMKQELITSSMDILSERENFPDKTLANLYDPANMPSSLKSLHKKNDHLIESLYKTSPFCSDDQRLEHLFKLYKKMTGGQSA